MDRRALLRGSLPFVTLLAGCTSDFSTDNNNTTTQTSSTTPSTSATTNTSGPSSTSMTNPTETETRGNPNEPTSSSATSTTETQGTTTTPQTTSTTESTTSTTQRTTTTQQTTEEIPSSAPNHPSVDGLFNEPTQGPKPFTAKATMIAFEDPSCPSCVQFETNTYPKLKKNLIDSGELSFVYRSFPIVKPWGVKATYALDAVYARSESGFWDLKAYYFDNQDQFSSQNVMPKTKEFVDEDLGMSGQTIVAEVQSKKHKQQVREDMLAGKKSNIRGTPSFHLFRSGKHLTKVTGSQSYRVFKNALGL